MKKLMEKTEKFNLKLFITIFLIHSIVPTLLLFAE